MVDKLFAACKAVIVNDGKVLILRESSKYDDGTNVGRFDFPGGRVKPGEHFKEGLVREIREETGLDVEVKHPIAVNEWRPEIRGEKWQIIATFFLCKASSSQVKLSQDHDHFEWIDPKAYKEFNNIPTNYPAFEALLDFD